ncbi:MAG TPA: hypothetical protein VNK26_01680 [Pyrinomonadaceae bacterium]|nr:hypothetical protein [Pyrinomonadaceae bacterium]
MKLIKTHLIAVCLTLLVLFASSEARAQGFGKDELIKAARFLEAKPFDEQAKIIRGLAVKYVIETDEVSVTVCGGKAAEPLLDKKNKNGPELTAQYTIGMAAFKLQNPNNDNELDAQLAGFESALKAYEAMISEKPKTKHPGMDDLVNKRNSGELRNYLDANGCSKK